MAQLFPRWTNKIPAVLIIGIVFLAIAITFFFWYYGSPRYTEIGYRPKQPAPYSHKLHAGDLGLDCRYCHYDIEVSPVANVPPTQVCMNCHKQILTESEKLLPVRESWASGVPIQWVRVHKLPDFAFFNHRAHLRAGVGCASCHGNVANMEVVQVVTPLSMSWCLNCHRNPDMTLRRANEITDMNWTPPKDQLQFAARVKKEKSIAPPTECSGCHR